MPHHSVPRLGSACPHSGIAPWAAAKGHPWPSAAIPASMPGCPLRNACVRPAWFNGATRSRSRSRSRSRAKARSRAGRRPASRWLNHRYREQARSHSGPVVNTRLMNTQDPLWERACSRCRRHIQHHRKLNHRYREQARSHTHPTGETRSHQEPGRLSGRLAVDVDLGRPVNHAG